MKFYLFVLFLLFSTSVSLGQSQLNLFGKVTADQPDLDDITVFNKTQKYEKVTAPGGYFSLKVQMNDTLIFKSEYLYDYEHVVSSADFKTDLLQVKIVKLAHILDEIKINKALDPVAFGILSKPAKQYTTTERRLYTASSGPVSLIVNTLNGERRMYKNMIKLENQVGFENKFINLYGRTQLSNDFKILDLHIEQFSQYACRHKNVVEAVKNDNAKILKFILIDIVRAYKKEFNEK